jgi:hypothetical protein
MYVGVKPPVGRARRLVTSAVLALALGLLIVFLYGYFQRGIVPGDAFTYLAAGERLNAGHALYALSPGDRPVALQPPQWTVPLISPPPIAVVFRAFALLPGDSGAYAWWILQLLALATALLMLGRRLPLGLGLAMLVLLIPTVYEIGVGNLNSMVLLGAILGWRCAVRGPEFLSGVIGAALTVVKLTPATLVWWLLATRRWQAVVAAGITGLLGLGLSILGAGWETHVEYLQLLGSGTAFGISPLSLGGMAVFVGLPIEVARLLPTVAIAVGLVVIVLLGRSPGLAFGMAILTMIYGSPAVSINWYVLLYALLAPIAWPASNRDHRDALIDQPLHSLWPTNR